MTTHRILKTAFASAVAAASLCSAASASDHLDTPTVIADPAADIGDLYAWTSADGRRLNLVMDIVGGKFSDKVAYVFHVDSGRTVGHTAATIAIDCRFDEEGDIRCEAGDDRVAGAADGAQGIESAHRRFRVFAGLRDDPFANNVRGTRQAYDVAAKALQAGVARDGAGCPRFDAATAHGILDRWRHTDGGPAQNLLAGWKSAALVVSIDLSMVNRGGPVLGVWSATYAIGGADAELDAPIDRAGRPLTGNALLGPLDPEADSDRRKEQYNRAAQTDWPSFVPDIQRTLALYDGFDGVCGNAWRAKSEAQDPERYWALAELLADDRLWVDSRAKVCARFMGVERANAGAKPADCGGRTPDSDAVDVYRALLVNGTDRGVEDGIDRDDKRHSSVDFPFLAAP